MKDILIRMSADIIELHGQMGVIKPELDVINAKIDHTHILINEMSRKFEAFSTKVENTLFRPIT